MNLKIRGEKLEITNAMKEYASNKINKLSKYLEQQEQIQSNICFITNDRIIFNVCDWEKEKVMQVIQKSKEYLTYDKFSNFVISETGSF